MIVTMKELARDGSDLIVMPDPGGLRPLDKYDRSILRAFEGLAFEISSYAGLPLRAYVLGMGDNPRRLGIFPHIGGVIRMNAERIELKTSDGIELVIHRYEHPSDHDPS